MAKAVTVKIEGLNDLLRATKGDLSKQMRQKSKAIAEPVAAEARKLAGRGTPVMQALAPAIKAKSDRLPVVVGGTMAKRLTSSRQPNRAFFLGAEFGDDTGRYRQFGKPKKGGQSVYPAVWANRDNTARQFLDAIEEVWSK